MSDNRDIFGRPLDNRPAHMNTFLRLDEPKSKKQIPEESGYTNVNGHVDALVKERKVVSAGRGRGYVINVKWFNQQPESARRAFLASCGIEQGTVNTHSAAVTEKTQYWCLNFDHEACLQHGIQNNLWLMQYQYPDLLGNEFQGGNQKGATTRNWKRLGQIRPGDKVVTGKFETQSSFKSSRTHAIASGGMTSHSSERWPINANCHALDVPSTNHLVAPASNYGIVSNTTESRSIARCTTVTNSLRLRLPQPSQ